MTAVLADTHALVWYVEGSSRLSSAAEAAMRSAGDAGHPVYISVVSLVEVAYLVEKKRLPGDTFETIVTALQQGAYGLIEVPFDLAMADRLRTIPVAAVPDMPDRMIAATASCLNVPVVTRDPKIVASGMATIW